MLPYNYPEEITSNLAGLPKVIKKNQTFEQRFINIESRITELEKRLNKFSTKTIKEILADITEIKLVCNRLHRSSKVRTQPQEAQTPAPTKTVKPTPVLNGPNPTKERNS